MIAKAKRRQTLTSHLKPCQCRDILQDPSACARQPTRRPESVGKLAQVTEWRLMHGPSQAITATRASSGGFLPDLANEKFFPPPSMVTSPAAYGAVGDLVLRVCDCAHREEHGSQCQIGPAYRSPRASVLLQVCGAVGNIASQNISRSRAIVHSITH